MSSTRLSRAVSRSSAILQTEKPSVLGIYANLMTRGNVVEIIRVAREAGWRVIVGGPEPGAYAQEFLESGADFVVFGEGEATMQELLAAFRDGADRSGNVWKSTIAGTAYLDDEGCFIRTLRARRLLTLMRNPGPRVEQSICIVMSIPGETTMSRDRSTSSPRADALTNVVGAAIRSTARLTGAATRSRSWMSWNGC